jgi:putative membrane protein
MWLISALFLVALVWMAAGMANLGRRDDADSPRRILGERFARGDIDRDEYQERVAALKER